MIAGGWKCTRIEERQIVSVLFVKFNNLFLVLQQVKAIERFMRRLDFHLSKVCMYVLYVYVYLSYYEERLTGNEIVSVWYWSLFMTYISKQDY